jgi:hypothetical protein
MKLRAVLVAATLLCVAAPNASAATQPPPGANWTEHYFDSADGQAVKSWTSTVAECSRALGAWLAEYAAQRGWAVSPAQGS